MKVSRFFARQFANPSGLFGSLITGMLLNRANIKSNQQVFEKLTPCITKSVLEIGFGGGDLLFKLATEAKDCVIHGIDMSTAMVQRARAKAARAGLQAVVLLEQGSIESLPYRDQQFDSVCTVNTVYFWSDLGTGIAEIDRVLQSEGHLVIGFGSSTAMRDAGYEAKGYRLYDRSEIESAFSQRGFELVDSSTTQRQKRGDFHVLTFVKKPSSLSVT